jgi:radical SAM/Cys-rich protein
MGRSLPTLAAQRARLSHPREQLSALARALPDRSFAGALRAAGEAPLAAHTVDVLQVNVGRVCNQTCRHCHVDAGPDRRETMSRETMEHCLRALERSNIHTVDITGGAPELNPCFRWFAARVRALGRHVIDRCNLTILETPSHRDLPEFFARHRIEVVASLPHGSAVATDRQRGDGVFETSIRALRRLNDVGYGDGRSGLRLVLVSNPTGAFLPASQASLEREWKRDLREKHGVVFDALYTITNMPISRYLDWLVASKNLDRYMEKLVTAFNPQAARGVMCRSLVSVGWDGTLYDCDFNQMLELPIRGAPARIEDFDAAALARRPVVVDRHCFGCTAGAGSSCGGTTA